MRKQKSEDSLVLAAEAPRQDGGQKFPWKILVVDDDEDIHGITTLVLADRDFQNQPFELLHAYSSDEAISLLEAHSDIAVLLLDIIMGTDDAGLRVAQYIRHTICNDDVKIIMRTGQPGRLSERSAALDYGVNYYEPKSQITADRLYAIVCMALEAYQATMKLKAINTKLTASMNDLQLFTDTIAHDIKAPAREMATIADLLVDECKNMNSEIVNLACALRDCGQTMVVTIDELLRLSRLGHGALTIEATDLKLFFNEILKKYANSLKAIDAKVNLNVSGSVLVDQGTFAHVIGNIIENSIKYRHKLEPLHIEIDCEKTSDLIKLTLSDNGIGIDEEAGNRLFLPFRRGRNIGEIPGNGIGLAFCHRIMALNGGAISAHKRPEGGTAICMTLPTMAS